MSWFLVTLFLNLTFGFLSEAAAASHHHKKLPSAVVVGTVYCDTCFQQDFTMGSHFISGASVSVECKDDGSSKPRFNAEVKTNEHGEFKVKLPFSVSKHVKKIKECRVRLISSSEPYCAVASSATSSSLLLKSRKQGLHVFSAGFFSFKPLKQPNLCNQKPILNNQGLGALKKIFPPRLPKIDPSFPPPIEDPNAPNGGIISNLPPVIPSLPELPQLPPLPPLPLLPGLPIPRRPQGAKESIPAKTSEDDQKVVVVEPQTFNLPPNPFQSPPLIPNPLLQPPTTPLIPNPFQPSPPSSSSSSSPSPLFPFPTVPAGSPSLPFPFPPLFPPPGSASSAQTESSP